MRTMTITEALAELKTLDKRVQKKRETVGGYLMRQEAFKDPFAGHGGTQAYIVAERQAIADLESNIVTIRTEIQRANLATSVRVGDTERSITEWLIWRRDVAPKAQQFLATLRGSIDNTRRQAMQKGVQVVGAGAPAATPNDVVVNIDEKALAVDIEAMETTLGTLDGLLSLKNATVTIDVP